MSFGRSEPIFNFCAITFVAALLTIPYCGLWTLAAWVLSAIWLVSWAGSGPSQHSTRRRRDRHF
jgi:hypothetical protein